MLRLSIGPLKGKALEVNAKSKLTFTCHFVMVVLVGYKPVIVLMYVITTTVSS